MGVTEQGEDWGDQNVSRGDRVIAKLRDEHLNEEERNYSVRYVLSIKMCFTCLEIN